MQYLITMYTTDVKLLGTVGMVTIGIATKH